jgi:hypothetical protein
MCPLALVIDPLNLIIHSTYREPRVWRASPGIAKNGFADLVPRTKILVMDLSKSYR